MKVYTKYTEESKNVLTTMLELMLFCFLLFFTLLFRRWWSLCNINRQYWRCRKSIIFRLGVPGNFGRNRRSSLSSLLSETMSMSRRLTLGLFTGEPIQRDCKELHNPSIYASVDGLATNFLKHLLDVSLPRLDSETHVSKL